MLKLYFTNIVFHQEYAVFSIMMIINSNNERMCLDKDKGDKIHRIKTAEKGEQEIINKTRSFQSTHNDKVRKKWQHQ